jgi:hypothetical protein
VQSKLVRPKHDERYEADANIATWAGADSIKILNVQ